jgi:hypothetical protein
MPGMKTDPSKKPEDFWLSKALRNATSLDTPQDQPLAQDAGEMAAGFIPGVGQAMALRDFERARREDDKLGMGLSAVSLIPGGALVKALAGAKLGLIGGAMARKKPVSAMGDALMLKSGGKTAQEQWDITAKRFGDKERSYVGPEGMPQFEISDVNSRPIHTETKDMLAAQAFHHPEGYDQYPHLKDIKITGTANYKGDQAGAKFIPHKYGKDQHGIEINARTPDEYHDWILHEFNHGVAAIEPGFSKGTNPEHTGNELVGKFMDQARDKGLPPADWVPNEYMAKALRSKADKIYEDNAGEQLSRAVEKRRKGQFREEVPSSHVNDRAWNEADGIPGVDY